jgi:hypothetical protein
MPEGVDSQIVDTGLDLITPAPATKDSTLPAGGAGDGGKTGPELPAFYMQLAKPELEALKKELQADPSLLERLPKNQTEVFKAMRAAQGTVAKALIRPDKEAPKEQWDQYRKAAGIPEAPEGYVFDKPDLPEGMGYNEGMEKWLRATLHTNHVPAAEAKAIFSEWTKVQVARYEQARAKNKADFEACTTKLKETYKDDYDIRVAGMSAALKAFATKGFIEKMKSQGLDNDPDTIETWVNIGKRLMPDPVRLGSNSGASVESDRPPSFVYGWMNKEFPPKKT